MTEPALLRALVSAARLAPVKTAAGTGHPSLPANALRVLTATICPAADMRPEASASLSRRRCRADAGGLLPIRPCRRSGAAEDASPTNGRWPIHLEGAAPCQVWVADRHFCVRTLLEGQVAAGTPSWTQHGTSRLCAQGECACGSCETARYAKHSITLEGPSLLATHRARPDGADTDDGRSLWSNARERQRVRSRRCTAALAGRWTVPALSGCCTASPPGRPRAALAAGLRLRFWRTTC